MATKEVKVSSILSQLDVSDSEDDYSDIANFILSLVVRELDLAPLAGKIIRLLALPYPPFKRVVCAYLTRYSPGISGLNILASNSFVKDFQDPNPVIRRLVLKTVCRIPCLLELALQLLPQAFCDGSSYVRCSAATSCSLINANMCPDIIEKLYEMIRDPDPSVVCSTLCALEEILYAEGGIVINSKIALYVIGRLSEFPEWNFPIAYKVLKKYIPKNREELLYFFNVLDEKILDFNPIIFTLAADLALYYISKLDIYFSEDIIEQISPQFKGLLNHSSAEILNATLDVIFMFLPDHKTILSSFHYLFFCNFCDTVLVKIKKLQILVELINVSNISEIAEELLLHCCDNVKEVSINAVHSFTLAVQKYPDMGSFLSTFVCFMDIQYNNLNERVLKALSLLDLSNLGDIKDSILLAVSKHTHISGTEGKMSLLKILSNYGNEISISPYIIEQLLDDGKNLDNEILMVMLLSTSIKLFLWHPAQMQLLLGFIIQHTKKSDCMLFKKLGSIYYYLLKDLSLVQKVMRINNKSIQYSKCMENAELPS